MQALGILRGFFRLEKFAQSARVIGGNEASVRRRVAYSLDPRLRSA